MKKLFLFVLAYAVFFAQGQDRRELEDWMVNRKIDDTYNVYWGDLHNHSDLSYGHGSFENALENAVQQLDFFTITPHALWPDMAVLANHERLGWVVNYHATAFDKLRDPVYWQQYLDKLKACEVSKKVVTFPSYEVHSLEHGDHVVVSKSQEIYLPKPDASILELRDEILNKENTIITPHGIGYQAGYRGYDWRFFKEGNQTPFVEIFSRHGGSEGSVGPFGMYHDMGPRSYEGTAESGLEKGHKFGIMASSDSHAGFPGGYGDGRIAVLAKELTRDAIWEAIQKRRVYATTGANIKIDFRINNAYMGEVIQSNASNKREIHVHVEGVNQLDYIELIKNGHTLKRVSTDFKPAYAKEGALRAKIKLEMGWNQVDKKERVEWNGELKLSGGQLLEAVPQFRGAPFTSPQKDMDGLQKPWESSVNKIVKRTKNSVSFQVFSEPNPSPQHSITQSIMLDVVMRPEESIEFNVNGKQYKHTLKELLEGSRAHFLNDWLSESILFNRAVPESGFILSFDLDDASGLEDTEDYYYLRVRQLDDQWAWSSPIWVESKN